MSRDFNLETHKAWLGLLQPVGLVVSPVALTQAQAAVDNNSIESQSALKRLLNSDGRNRLELAPSHYEKFFTNILDWCPDDLRELPSDSELGSVFLKEYQETLSATHAVFESKESTVPLVLIQQISDSVDFDSVDEGVGWRASVQSKFERILREKAVSIGLLLSPLGVRLVYAPRGESSGYVTFPFSLMSEVQGRIVLGALKMLLGADRLFTLAQKERLPNLLLESRKYQNTVSTQLSEQVLGALYELLRGLQAGSDRTNGALLKDVLADEPNRVYHGLLTVLLRNVFMLFAEDRDLIPAHPIYNENYSIKGLFEKLRADESRYADTMDQRYGAWAQLISIYRIIYEGIKFPGFSLPARRGHLFDPNRFPFLEGRNQKDDPVNPPLISDGVVYRVLRNLMILDGERISYRTLDVEQIGSVYETVMGFRLEIATGPSIAIRPKKAHGAPVVIDLEKLLSLKNTVRSKWFKENADQEIYGSALTEASTIEELEAALDRKIARIATPTIIAKDSMVLQPSDERRRSGSHYTPRSLTEPIVKKALDPIFAQMGTNPEPDQILGVKICDPAMGSGAFLVEATRQLSDALVKAWRIHNQSPKIPVDEDDLLFARRLIVQRCIYGVDKNPMAVDLAKLSLWLATFAKDHAFTFLDHTLKCGDSLMGLTLDQIAKGNWKDSSQDGLFTQSVRAAVAEYLELRQELSYASEEEDYDALVLLNDEAQQRVQRLRAAGDLILHAFNSGKTEKERSSSLLVVQPTLSKLFQLDTYSEFEPSAASEFRCFHWEIEFPEVFQRATPGFDVLVGNPPFIAGKDISSRISDSYLAWIKASYPSSGGQTDLCAYFLRRAYFLLRQQGTIGLITTNTIYQGDTRKCGLGTLVEQGCTIFSAIRRLPWPGQAAVTVSSVWIIKGDFDGLKVLDGKECGFINRYLMPVLFNSEPNKLVEYRKRYDKGFMIYGDGFLFCDEKSGATSLSTMEEIFVLNPACRQLVHPYIGGDDVLSNPVIPKNKFVIDFEQRSLEEAQAWPELLNIISEKVKPERELQNRVSRSQLWWQFGEKSPLLRKIYAEVDEVLMIPFTAQHLTCVKVPTNVYVAYPHTVLRDWSPQVFAILQSRIHELWARFFGSTLEDRLRYPPSDCLETFPFPIQYVEKKTLGLIGEQYYKTRLELMVRLNVGPTELYNRFHSEDEMDSDVLKLRELHTSMDREVLEVYGWTDLRPQCAFLLDFEDDALHESGSQKKKPWRYRWPNEVREEVLARLLDLNASRGEQEKTQGLNPIINKRQHI